MASREDNEELEGARPTGALEDLNRTIAGINRLRKTVAKKTDLMTPRPVDSNSAEYNAILYGDGNSWKGRCKTMDEQEAEMA